MWLHKDDVITYLLLAWAGDERNSWILSEHHFIYLLQPLELAGLIKH